MQYYPVSLSIRTDKSQYTGYENVIITVFVAKDGVPSKGERIRLLIFQPSGKRIFNSRLTTDSFGVAVALFHLQKPKVSGNYSVEAHSTDGSMGLSSFLVFSD
ncbi:MAG: MG2 domain-containing protein [Bacillota bacterium]|nr:MG2 domain-containing protein [Bacillota bacterium]MDW7682525.1 MG2 domain-containing protein [Bacillota bacterium]